MLYSYTHVHAAKISLPNYIIVIPKITFHTNLFLTVCYTDNMSVKNVFSRIECHLLKQGDTTNKLQLMDSQ